MVRFSIMLSLKTVLKYLPNVDFMYWSLMTTHVDLVLADSSQTKKRASQGPGVPMISLYILFQNFCPNKHIKCLEIFLSNGIIILKKSDATSKKGFAPGPIVHSATLVPPN